MTIEQIRKSYEARPFRPFRLRLADGNEYRVAHPEFLMLSPGGRTIAVATPDDAIEIIDLLLVASLHFDKPQRRNGRR
jgi:hypothetical protein